MGVGPAEILSLWERHRDAPWPHLSGSHEGELMTLDTVISGCVVYYLESEAGLDDQRVEMLRSCLDELTGLLSDLPEEDVSHYFGRLSRLARLLLEHHGGLSNP
jgi:hypothetical protein